MDFPVCFTPFCFAVESFETLGENTGRSTPRLSPPKKEATGAPYRSTRFGFRLNRPNSTGVVSKNLSCDNVNNNNADIKPNGKFTSFIPKINRILCIQSTRGMTTTDIMLIVIWHSYDYEYLKFYLLLFLSCHSGAALFLGKPRSKSACGSRRSVASSLSSNSETQQRQPTVHFQLPSPISSPQKHESQSKKTTDPKINAESIDVTAINNNNNNINNNNGGGSGNNNYANSRANTQLQRKMFFMQSSPIQNVYNQHKPPSGKRSFTIINTELHTNEMWVYSQNDNLRLFICICVCLSVCVCVRVPYIVFMP